MSHKNDLLLLYLGFPRSHVSAHVREVSFCPPAHGFEWSDDYHSQLRQRILDSNGLRLRHPPGN